jgi:GR25 family glycosyltransferase involved in LPS biosynthesis
MIQNIYFIVHKEKEPERYKSILNIIDKFGFKNYSILKQLWASDITYDMRRNLCKTNRTSLLHGRIHPLSNGEISLFLNYISCLKEIRETYTDGYFIIFESDILLNSNFNAELEKVLELAKNNNDWDIINIGSGQQEVPENIIPGLHLYKAKRNRCAEGIIWKYSAVCKFLDYVKDIDGPIDTKMDVFCEFDGGFNIYWAHPPLVYQGSKCGVFQSYLR